MLANLPLAAAVRIREPADHTFPLGGPLALRVIGNLIDEVGQ